MKLTPTLLDTSGFHWEKHREQEFWIGSSPNGQRWLFKMRGGFRSQREYIASKILNKIGVPSQTSKFVILTDMDYFGLSDKNNRCQLAINMLKEHPIDICGHPSNAVCPYKKLREMKLEKLGTLDKLRQCGVENADTIVALDILAYLLGATEPSGFLVTIDHKIYVIDNELCFSSDATNPLQIGWESPYLHESEYRELVLKISMRLASITEEMMDSYSLLPTGYNIEEAWQVKPILMSVISNAKRCVEKYA